MTDTPDVIEACGDWITGLWCDHCALPSGYGLVVLHNDEPCFLPICSECRTPM